MGNIGDLDMAGEMVLGSELGQEGRETTKCVIAQRWRRACTLFAASPRTRKRNARDGGEQVRGEE
jgi:hypothetical protein